MGFSFGRSQTFLYFMLAMNRERIYSFERPPEFVRSGTAGLSDSLAYLTVSSTCCELSSSNLLGLCSFCEEPSPLVRSSMLLDDWFVKGSIKESS